MMIRGLFLGSLSLVVVAAFSAEAAPARWLLALPCHLRFCQAFLPGEGARRRGAMEGMHADGWEEKLEHWLEPFLARLRRKELRRWAPGYLKGLNLPRGGKSG